MIKPLFPRILLMACCTLIGSYVTAGPVTTKSLKTYTQLRQQGVEYFSDVPTVSGEYDWALLVFANKGEQFLSVFDRQTNKPVFQYSHQGALDAFMRLQVIESESYGLPLIASVWRRGVHGEQFILLDPVNREILYRLTSAWPLHIQACHQGIAITLTDTGTEGSPIHETHLWYGPDNIHINKGDGRGCMTDAIPENILPLDDSHQSPSLREFMQRFDNAVLRKDFAAVKGFTATDILNSFGGEGGMKEFLLSWKGHQDSLFETLLQIRKGGGRLTWNPQGIEAYCMPRMFTDFPTGLNAFSHGVIVGEAVPVYVSPDKKSRVLTHLSHAIVGVDDWVSKKDRWQPVRLKQDVLAYIEASKVRSPIDYRACFARDKAGQWHMTQLVAGD